MLQRIAVAAACVWVMGFTAELAAQTPAKPAPAPGTETKPAPPKPAPAKRTAATGGRGVTLTVSVTDGTGNPVRDARVFLTGPITREGETIADGSVRLTGLRAGNYRVRAEHDGFITLEREVTMRGQAQTIEMTLSDAPEPEPEPFEAPEPRAPLAADAPPGDARAIDITEFLEQHFISEKEPYARDALGCTASARTTLLQVLEPTKEEANPDADEVLYAIAGEGTLRLGNKDVPFSSKKGSVAIVPRGTARALTRKGRSVLTVLSVVSGPSCTAAPSQ
jgi:mannose-6-phosphate isomerase-like protein (cupin superfamily)